MVEQLKIITKSKKKIGSRETVQTANISGKTRKPKRLILSLYRLSAHHRVIKIGWNRQKYKSMKSRLCQQCYQEALDDEVYFLLWCSKYLAVRHTYLRRFSNLFHNFSSMEGEEKLYILLGKEENTGACHRQRNLICHGLNLSSSLISHSWH